MCSCYSFIWGLCSFLLKTGWSLWLYWQTVWSSNAVWFPRLSHKYAMCFCLASLRYLLLELSYCPGGSTKDTIQRDHVERTHMGILAGGSPEVQLTASFNRWMFKPRCLKMIRFLATEYPQWTQTLKKETNHLWDALHKLYPQFYQPNTITAFMPVSFRRFASNTIGTGVLDLLWIHECLPVLESTGPALPS